MNTSHCCTNSIFPKAADASQSCGCQLFGASGNSIAIALSTIATVGFFIATALVWTRSHAFSVTTRAVLTVVAGLSFLQLVLVLFASSQRERQIADSTSSSSDGGFEQVPDHPDAEVVAKNLTLDGPLPQATGERVAFCQQLHRLFHGMLKETGKANIGFLFPNLDKATVWKDKGQIYFSCTSPGKHGQQPKYHSTSFGASEQGNLAGPALLHLWNMREAVAFLLEPTKERIEALSAALASRKGPKDDFITAPKEWGTQMIQYGGATLRPSRITATQRGFQFVYTRTSDENDASTLTLFATVSKGSDRLVFKIGDGATFRFQGFKTDNPWITEKNGLPTDGQKAVLRTALACTLATAYAPQSES